MDSPPLTTMSRQVDPNVPSQFPHGALESLPFSVRVVRDLQDLKMAVEIRHSAYARHMPEFAQTLQTPEAADSEPGVSILLALSKHDGSPVGTMRIQTNTHQPLALEKSVHLPAHLSTCRLAEATRLGVTRDRVGRLVKIALFKCFYEYCVDNDIDWMVVAGRHPIDRQYEAMHFQDVCPDLRFIPMLHANGVPHRVMALKVASVESSWRRENHPLCDFMFDTFHADLARNAKVSNPG
jgi:hypothetical protein